MKNYKIILGITFIVLSILILIILPNIVYPKIYVDGIDTDQYFLEIIINVVRYIVLSILSFALGIKILFKNN